MKRGLDCISDGEREEDHEEDASPSVHSSVIRFTLFNISDDDDSQYLADCNAIYFPQLLTVASLVYRATVCRVLTGGISSKAYRLRIAKTNGSDAKRRAGDVAAGPFAFDDFRRGRRLALSLTSPHMPVFAVYGNTGPC